MYNTSSGRRAVGTLMDAKAPSNGTAALALEVYAPDYRLSPQRPLWARAHWHPTVGPPTSSIHHGLEVGIVLRGREEVEIGGIVMGGSAGDVWVCDMSEPHEFRVSAPHTRNLVFVFLPCFLGHEAIGDLPWLTLFALPPQDRPHVLDAQTRRVVLGIAQELEEEVERQSQGWQFAVRLGLIRLLFALTRTWRPTTRTSARLTQARGLTRVLPAVTLLHEDPGAPLSRADAARVCGLSRSRFAVLFRETMGVGFAAFRRRARTAFAAHLLSTTGRPVEQIAAQAGFADASHLHRCFLAEYGCTPGQYRDQARVPGWTQEVRTQ